MICFGGDVNSVDKAGLNGGDGFVAWGLEHMHDPHGLLENNYLDKRFTCTLFPKRSIPKSAVCYFKKGKYIKTILFQHTKHDFTPQSHPHNTSFSRETESESQAHAHQQVITNPHYRDEIAGENSKYFTSHCFTRVDGHRRDAHGYVAGGHEVQLWAWRS